MSLADSIQNSKLLALRFATDSPRRLIQSRRNDILNDSGKVHVEQAIQNRFFGSHNLGNHPNGNAADIIRFMDMSNNCYKFFIRQLSIVYKKEATRTFVGDNEETNLWKAVAPEDLDLTMESANRVTQSQNECLIRPLIREGELEFDVLLPHNVEVLANAFHLQAVLYRVDGGFVYWDKEFSFEANGEGLPFDDTIAPNPYKGVLPFVVYRREKPVDSFWLGQSGEDLVDSYINQVILNSFLDRILFYQSYFQLTRKQVATGMSMPGQGDSTSDLLELGPHVYLEGDWNVLNLQADLDKYRSIIDKKLERTAVNWGFSPSIITGTKYTSGYEQMVDMSRLLENRQSTIKSFKVSDKKLMNLARLVWNTDSAPQVDKFSLSSIPHIDYGEITAIESPKDSYATLQQGISLGIDSPVDYELRRNPDLGSRDEALIRIARNLEDNALVLKARQEYSTLEAQNRDNGSLGGRPADENPNPSLTEEAIKDSDLEGE